jgi:hypothetical protein
LQQRLLLKREYPALLAQALDEVSKIGGIFTLKDYSFPWLLYERRG